MRVEAKAYINRLKKPKVIRLISTVIAVVLALPLQWFWLTGFYMWLSPFVMLNSLLLLKSMVLFNVAAWIILVVSFFRNRWFCRFLCPVGLGCDTFSKWGGRKNEAIKKLPRLGHWLALISLGAALTGIPLFIFSDPMSIFNGFFAAFSADFSFTVALAMSGLSVLLIVHLFLPGIWCRKLCPLGGLFDELTVFRKWLIKVFYREKKIRTQNSFGRRLFIATGTGLLAGVIVPKFLKQEHKTFFRPPASIPGNLFNTLCTRCGNCIKVCPTNIIVHHTATENIAAWMTPEIKFDKKGYCLEDCNLCGTVCPTGSISPFDKDAKKQLFMARIKIELENCLLMMSKECDRCKSVCPYDAIQIMPSEKSLLMIPVADLSKCVGCGACAAVCPAETIRMLPLASNTKLATNWYNFDT